MVSEYHDDCLENHVKSEQFSRSATGHQTQCLLLEESDMKASYVCLLLVLDLLPDWPASCSRHWPTFMHKASHTAAWLQKMCWSPHRCRFSQRVCFNCAQRCTFTTNPPAFPSSPPLSSPALPSSPPPLLHPPHVPLQGAVKLHNYGLYHMTGNGREVSFPIGYITNVERHITQTVIVGSLSVQLTAVHGPRDHCSQVWLHCAQQSKG